jgi:hypothetical protein
MTPIVPVDDASSIRRILCNFALGPTRSVAEQVYELLGKPALNGPLSFVDAVTSMSRPGTFAGNFEMVLLSLVFNVDVVSYSNYSTGMEVFSSSLFLADHIREQALSIELRMYNYHHQYMRQLSPAPPQLMIRLNHFALLIPTGSVAQASVILQSEKPHEENIASVD